MSTQDADGLKRLRNVWDETWKAIPADQSSRKAWLEANAPPMTVAQWHALVPQPIYDHLWTPLDEAHFVQQWQLDVRKSFFEGFDYRTRNKEALTLWKIFPRYYRCLPTEVIGARRLLQYNSSKNLPVNYQGQRFLNPLWPPRFCNGLTRISCHPLFEFSRDNLGLMAHIIQYAAICRMNDCRNWPLVNNTDSRFLDLFVSEIQANNGQRTVVELHDRVDALLAGKKQSPYSKLFREIERLAFLPLRPKFLGNGNLAVTDCYLVDASDLEVVLSGLKMMDCANGGNWNPTERLWEAFASNVRNAKADPPSNSQTMGQMMRNAMYAELRDRVRLDRASSPGPYNPPVLPHVAVSGGAGLQNPVPLLAPVVQTPVPLPQIPGFVPPPPPALATSVVNQPDPGSIVSSDSLDSLDLLEESDIEDTSDDSDIDHSNDLQVNTNHDLNADDDHEHQIDVHDDGFLPESYDEDSAPGNHLLAPDPAFEDAWEGFEDDAMDSEDESGPSGHTLAEQDLAKNSPVVADPSTQIDTGGHVTTQQVISFIDPSRFADKCRRRVMKPAGAAAEARDEGVE